MSAQRNGAAKSPKSGLTSDEYPKIGSPFRIKATGRVGKLLWYDPKDKTISHKLEFRDGIEPPADWFAPDEVEAALSAAHNPIIGSLARVKATGRVGKLIEFNPWDSLLSHKLKFSSEQFDWFPASALDVQPSLKELHERAEHLRSETHEQLKRLQHKLVGDFEEYKNRLQALGAADSSFAVTKILIGFIPGCHAVAEGASTTILLAEMHSLLKECADLGSLVVDMASMYETGSTDLQSQEDRLLTVLTRKVKIICEQRVGGIEYEPGKLVLQTLLQIKALAAKLRTLDEMGFYSQSSMVSTPEVKSLGSQEPQATPEACTPGSSSLTSQELRSPSDVCTPDKNRKRTSAEDEPSPQKPKEARRGELWQWT